MADESEDQEVGQVGDEPVADEDQEDASTDPLPVRQKTTAVGPRKDIGPRVASPQSKGDPRFEAAKARLERQEQLAEQQRRKKEEKLRKEREAKEAAATAESASEQTGSGTFSFNMTGERRETEK